MARSRRGPAKPAQLVAARHSCTSTRTSATNRSRSSSSNRKLRRSREPMRASHRFGKEAAMRRLLFAPVLAAVAIATTLAQAPAAGPERTLMDIERRWVAAALKNDVAGLDAILAPNWTG